MSNPDTLIFDIPASTSKKITDDEASGILTSGEVSVTQAISTNLVIVNIIKIKNMILTLTDTGDDKILTRIV